MDGGRGFSQSKVVFRIRQSELRGFEILFRNTALLVQHLPPFVRLLRVIEGGTGVDDTLLVLRISQRDRALRGPVHRCLRLLQRRCGLGPLCREVARFENGDHVAGTHGPIHQQRHLGNLRGNFRTDGRLALSGERRHGRDLVRNRAAFRFGHLHADDDVRLPFAGSAGVTPPPDNNNHQQHEN